MRKSMILGWTVVVACVVTASCSPSASGPNRPPVASAGPDLSAKVGTELVLDGTASYDPDGTPMEKLSFGWSVAVAPAGGEASIEGRSEPVARLVPDATGIWMVRLVVSDGELSDEDVATIRVFGCSTDADCDNGLFCDGQEICSNGDCVAGSPPCEGNCDEQRRKCEDCGNGSIDPGEDCEPQLGDHCCDEQTCRWVEQGLADPQGICVSQNPCVQSVCNGSGDCYSVSSPDGTPCGQGSCSGGDWVVPACRSGVCDGQLVTSCDDGNDCTTDECDSQLGCTSTAAPDGTECDMDGQFCTVDRCQSSQCTATAEERCPAGQTCDETNDTCGSCGNGTIDGVEECDPAAPRNDTCCDPTTCTWVSDAPAPAGQCPMQECNAAYCNSSHQCEQRAVGDGTACSLGVCCAGLCTAGNSCYDCAQRPPSFELSCSPDPVVLESGTDTACTLATGAPGAGGCIECSTSQASLLLGRTTFEQACSVSDPFGEGWVQVPGPCFNFVPSSCSIMAGARVGCCTNFSCDGDAWYVEHDTCLSPISNNGLWLVQRTFDTRGLSGLVLCLDWKENGTDINDGIMVALGDSAHQPFPVGCVEGMEGAASNDAWRTECFELPPWAADNPALRVYVQVKSGAKDHKIWVDNISLRGSPQACAATLLEFFSENFSDPALPGWDVSESGNGGLTVDSTRPCATGDSAAWAEEATARLWRYFDASDKSGLVLCFDVGSESAGGGEYVAVKVDTSGSQNPPDSPDWVELWRRGGDKIVPLPPASCEQVCVDLSTAAALKGAGQVDHNGMLGIMFELKAGKNKYMKLDNVSLRGFQDCDGPAVSLADTGQGEYGFSITNAEQTSIRATCRWLDQSGQSAAIDIDWRHVRAVPSWDVPVSGAGGAYDFQGLARVLCLNTEPVEITSGIDTDGCLVDGANVACGVVDQGGDPETAKDAVVMAFDSVRISNNVEVVGERALVLLSCRDIELGGVLDLCANGRSGGPGGFDGGDSEQDGHGPGGGGLGSGDPDEGAGGGGFGGRGGRGGHGVDGGDPYDFAGISQGAPLRGGSGGGGGSESGGQGGGGGGAVYMVAGNMIRLATGGGINACGAGGAEGSGGDSGGGGGAGGAIWLEAIDVIGTGTLAANGGGGGAGDWGGDGQPGEFGTSGGRGGDPNGSDCGGDGGGGDVPDGFDGCTSDDSGGGGGAAGRIQINTLGGDASMVGSGIVSPSVSPAFGQGAVLTR